MGDAGILEHHNVMLEAYRAKEGSGYLLNYKGKENSDIFKVRFSRESDLGDFVFSAAKKLHSEGKSGELYYVVSKLEGKENACVTEFFEFREKYRGRFI